MSFLPRRNGWRAPLAAVLFAAAGAAGAVNLQVAPTQVALPAERNAEGLVLRNSGQQPVHAQIRVFRWTQADGQDRLQPTGDLAISPPMLELPAGGEQLVRVVRLGPPPAAETSYRLIVDELPLEQPHDDARRSLRFVLRYSIPVFVAPRGAQPVAPSLRARLVDDAGARFLEIENLGNGHAQIADLRHVGNDGRNSDIAVGLSGYVLPQQRRRWPLPAHAAGRGGSFRARVNGEPDERILELDR